MTLKSSSAETELSMLIKECISSDGKISFHRFMDMALYHPRLGYYMSERTKIGWEGDFFTSPDLHPVLAVSIMKQLAEMYRIMGGKGKLKVIEAGAGKGELCRTILFAAFERERDLFDVMEYTIVEKSTSFIAIQKDHICSSDILKEKLSWRDSIEDALLGSECSIVVSNELLDAFPVHKVVYSDGYWQEIYVTVEEGAFREVNTPISDRRLEDYLAMLEGPFIEGYTTEINLDAMDWVSSVGRSLQKGFVLTIDYGYSRGDYFAPERTNGTLLCYHRHELSEDPYARVGEQDITAHIDFTSISEAGEGAGLASLGYCDQFHFLMGLGVFEEFNAMDETQSYDIDGHAENQAIKSLLMPEGMGGTFKVLIQSKGLEVSPELKAFSFRNRLNRL